MRTTGQRGHLNRRKKILKANKGYFGKSKNCYSIAIRAYTRAQKNRYVSKKLLKRQKRREWISTISNYARSIDKKYSDFVKPMQKFQLNRKVLSEMINKKINILNIFK